MIISPKKNWLTNAVLSLQVLSCLAFSMATHAQTDFFQKVRQWQDEIGTTRRTPATDSQWVKRLEDVDREIDQSKDASDRRSLKISKAIFLSEVDRQDEAIKIFEDLLSEKPTEKVSSVEQHILSEYLNFYLGRAYFKKGQLKQAKETFNQILDLSPNTKMQFEVELSLAQIYLADSNFKQARQLLTKLEKKQRRQDGYDQIVYLFAKTEKSLSNSAGFCKWVKVLYSQYPTYEKNIQWGSNLAQDEFEGQPTRCSVTHEDRRKRIKSLQWAGQNEKALQEIQSLRSSSSEDEKYDVDRLEVSYWLHEGEVEKALAILMPYYESKKNEVSYLSLVATTTARAGEAQASVGSYYKIYKLSPRSKVGRQALYQAAFLSYQFQDYDGAARKFQEFIKNFSTSGLSKDARWHLAWMRYLRADYSGAQRSLAELGKLSNTGRRKTRNAFPKDRLDYWTAMSLFRQNKFAESKPLFETLSKDPQLGFYSIAARLRLREVDAKLPRMNLKTKEEVLAKRQARFAAIEAKLSAEDLIAFRSIDDSEKLNEEELENEETLAAQTQARIDEIMNNDEKDSVGEGSEREDSEAEGLATEENLNNTNSEDDLPETRPNFSNPLLVKRFERAKELIHIGLNDWAKWDLYDIERKTRNREFLKNLMQEYQMVGNFHRSAYIAQTYFGKQRVLRGIDGERLLWETAFPKAYSQFVVKNAQTLEMEPELIWGIMRAESAYRKEVISPVGAMGLMQVMPSTGLKVANLIKDTEFKPQQLLQPATSIRIGAHYLKRLEKKFEGYIPLVAAAYNAGPHRVQSWLSQFGNLDVDEFVEHIPFLETRNYVKKVSSYFYTYSILYGNNKDALAYLNQPLKIALPEKAVAKESWDE